jgi:hypothetical protein
VEGVSPPAYKIINHKGKPMCSQCFCQYIAKDQALPVDKEVEHTFFPFEPSQDTVSFDIYATTATNAKFTTEPGMFKVGKVKVRGLQAAGLGTKYEEDDYELVAKMKFGGVAITVTVTDLQTGKDLSTKIQLPQAAAGLKLVSHAG